MAKYFYDLILAAKTGGFEHATMAIYQIGQEYFYKRIAINKKIMEKTKGFQLSQLTILYINFIVGMEQTEAFTPQQSIEEITKYISKSLPIEAQRVVLPMNEELYMKIHKHFQEGKRKIAVYRDGGGQRYIAADFIA